MSPNTTPTMGSVFHEQNMSEYQKNETLNQKFVINHCNVPIDLSHACGKDPKVPRGTPDLGTLKSVTIPVKLTRIWFRAVCEFRCFLHCEPWRKHDLKHRRLQRVGECYFLFRLISTMPNQLEQV